MANLMRVGGGGEYYAKLKIVVPEDITSIQCYRFNEDGSVTELFDGDGVESGSVLVTSSNTDDVVNQMYIVPEFPDFEVTVENDEVVYTLENYSWEAIARLVKAGLFSKMFSIGDTKTLTLSDGWSTVATIVGFNHDEKSDGTGTCEVTFDFTYLYHTETEMGESPVSSNYFRWSECNLRNIVIPDIWETLPDILKENIAEVTKNTGTYSVGFTSVSSTSYSTADKLWAFSLKELALSNFSDESSTAYPYFSEGGSRIKTLVDGTEAQSYWVRNAYHGLNISTSVATMTRNWYCINANGTAEYVVQSTAMPFVLGFCL